MRPFNVFSLSVAAALLLAVGVFSSPANAQQSPSTAAPPAWPERAIRRDIPLTPSIRHAYATGTRDSSGAPGSAVSSAFATYARTWRFKHPTPCDFFMSMNHSLGRNLDWFWYEWFFTNYTVDQSIESVDYTDGTSSTIDRPAESWFSGTRSQGITVPLGGKHIKSIALDPDNRFQDVDPTNNAWSAKVP